MAISLLLTARKITTRDSGRPCLFDPQGGFPVCYQPCVGLFQAMLKGLKAPELLFSAPANLMSASIGTDVQAYPNLSFVSRCPFRFTSRRP